MTERGRLARLLIGLAVGLPVLLIAGVVAVASVVRHQGGDAGSGPLALADVSAPMAGSAGCARLVAALPDGLASGGQRLARRQLAVPAPPAAAGWGGEQSGSGRAADQPVVLRCGVERPLTLTVTSSLVVISGVQWLQQPGQGTSTWFAVDRPVYVALTLPDGIGSGAIQAVSTVITQVLPTQPVDVGGG